MYLNKVKGEGVYGLMYTHIDRFLHKKPQVYGELQTFFASTKGGGNGYVYGYMERGKLITNRSCHVKSVCWKGVVI